MLAEFWFNDLKLKLTDDILIDKFCIFSFLLWGQVDSLWELCFHWFYVQLMCLPLCRRLPIFLEYFRWGEVVTSLDSEHLPALPHGSGVTTCFSLASHFSQGILENFLAINSNLISQYDFPPRSLEPSSVCLFFVGLLAAFRKKWPKVVFFLKSFQFFLKMLNISKIQQVTSSTSLFLRSKCYSKFKKVSYRDGVMVNGMKYYPK